MPASNASTQEADEGDFEASLVNVGQLCKETLSEKAKQTNTRQ